MNKYKYTAIIIEPRSHRALQFVLNNFLTNLSDEWNIIIFHGTDNELFVNDIITKLEKYKQQIKMVNIGVKNLSIRDYNNLLINKKIYDYINTDTFLIFQTDTLILNKEKLSKFLEYDYVGAPWNHFPIANTNERVGNGGLSLRKKSKMLEILNNIPYKGQNEDVYFCYNPDNKLHKPSFEEAKHFAVEEVFFNEPFGCHKPWNWVLSFKKEFFDLYPQAKELYLLNM